MEGINAEQSAGVVITDDSGAYADSCLAYLNEQPKELTNRRVDLSAFHLATNP